MRIEDGRIRWAARVPKRKIRQLYKTDAKGIVDEELIDEVGYAFLARCEDILMVTGAAAGRVRCPGCGEIILRRTHTRDEVLRCCKCS